MLTPQHPYVILREQLSGVYQDRLFADLYTPPGPAAESPGRLALALVTVLQFAEGLTDEQASQAVRTRIDWTYLLGLELTDPGFNASVLSEFRDRFVTGQAVERLLTVVLEVAQAHGLRPSLSPSTSNASPIGCLARLRPLASTGHPFPL